MFDVRALPPVGPVAQRLEQGTHNPLVLGSNPSRTTLPFRLSASLASQRGFQKLETTMRTLALLFLGVVVGWVN